MHAPRSAVVALLLGVCLATFTLGASATPALATQENVTAATESTANGSTANESTANATADADANVTVENLTVWSGPSEVTERLTNRSVIEGAQQRGAIRREGRLFVDETLVFELRMPGLDHRLGAAEGPNETARFFEATHGWDSWLAIRQTFDTTRPGADPSAVALNHANATTVVTDPRNHTYYVRVDLTSLPFRQVDYDDSPLVSGRKNDHRREIRGGQRFYLEVAFDRERTVLGGDIEDDPHVALLDDSTGKIELTSGGYLYGLESRRNLSVRVSGLPRGRNATIRISSPREDGPVRERTVPITATADGDTRGAGPPTAATATFNMSDFPAEAGFEVTALVDGVIVAEEGVRPKRLDSYRIELPANQTVRNGSIRVRRASLPENATLAVRFGPWWHEYADTAQVHGMRELDEGTHRNVTIQVRDERDLSPDSVTVFAVVAENGTESIDFTDQYLLEDGFVTGKWHVRFREDLLGATAPLSDAKPENRGNATGSDATTPDRRTASNGSLTADTTTGGEDGPGFGVLATLVAVLALIALGGRN